jgi:hypothetical protein
MAAELQNGRSGYHRFLFRVDGGRAGMFNVAVQISEDAYRKLVGQLARARIHPLEKVAMLKHWARWEIARRLEEEGTVPGTITIAVYDVDDSGAYATALGRTLSLTR